MSLSNFTTSKITTGFVAALALAILLAPAPLTAHAQAPAAPAAAPATSGTRLHGTVTDPDGELIPGAKVMLTPGKGGGGAKTTTSGSDGTYSLTLPSGTYTLVVSMPGFSTYNALNFKVQPAAGQSQDFKLQVGVDNIVINVDDTASQLSVDPDNNASSTIISGDALAALSDDPDDLAAELSALAGPAAGPNGGTIYIDGFTGGQLPPKASIREIRINQNPFSAQYDKPGFGRVEVFTKPGTDSYHGSAQLSGNDNIFNTGSPYIASSVPQPGYHTILANGQLSGPLNKKSSFTMGAQYRSIHNNTIIDPEGLYSLTSSPGTLCAPLQTVGCSTYGLLGYVADVSAPQTRYDLSPRLDLALGSKNTLTVRYRFEHATLNNQGIGGNQLQANSYTSTQSEQDIQASDTETINSKVINEIHFEWQRSTTGSVPLNNTPQVTVAGAFTAGGDASQGTTNDIQNHLEYQDYMSIALKHNFIRLGGRLRTTYDNNTTNANAQGSFLFGSTTVGATTTSGLTNYINGTPTQFTYTLYNQPTVKVTSIDAGIYAEDDWKIKPSLTLSYGARFETQNFIGDKADFAPRVSVAWGVGKKKAGGPLFVLRGGFGLFYDRLPIGDQENTVQENGVAQIPFTTSTPTYNSTNCNVTLATGAGCGATPAGGHTTIQSVQSTANMPNGYKSPYQEQANLGADIAPFKNATVSFNYQHVVGIHQLVNVNLNAKNDWQLVATAPNNGPTAPINDTYITEGYYRQNQFITNFNYRGSAKWTLSSYYVLNFDTKSDTSGGTNPYNLGSDYGRAQFGIRSNLFLFGTFNLPHLISLSPLLQARSGQPLNITTGEDNFGFLTNNTRPELVPAGTPGSKQFGSCGAFLDPGKSLGNPNGYAQIPVNYCTGPAAFTTNLRISKAFGFGKKAAAVDPTAGMGGDQGGGGPRGGGAGGGGGARGGGMGGAMGGGGGRGGGGGMGGGRATGKKYNFNVGVQFQNIFNVVDRSAPNTTLSSASFGGYTSLAGQLYTTNDAVRRVQLSASFNF